MVMGVVIEELGYLGIKLLIINNLYQFKLSNLYQFHYLNLKKNSFLINSRSYFFYIPLLLSY